MRASAIAGLACLLAACSPPAQTASNGTGGGAVGSSVQPGQYRTTATVLELNMPGMSSTNVTLEPTTTEECVAASDIDELMRDNLLDTGPDETCTQNSMSSSGGRIQGESTCTGEYGVRAVRMEGSYTSNHVEMEINVSGDMPEGRGQMSQRMRIVTDRIGDCPEGEAAQ